MSLTYRQTHRQEQERRDCRVHTNLAGGSSVGGGLEGTSDSDTLGRWLPHLPARRRSARQNGSRCWSPIPPYQPDTRCLTPLTLGEGKWRRVSKHRSRKLMFNCCRLGWGGEESLTSGKNIKYAILPITGLSAVTWENGMATDSSKPGLETNEWTNWVSGMRVYLFPGMSGRNQ